MALFDFLFGQSKPNTPPIPLPGADTSGEGNLQIQGMANKPIVPKLKPIASAPSPQPVPAPTPATATAPQPQIQIKPVTTQMFKPAAPAPTAPAALTPMSGAGSGVSLENPSTLKAATDLMKEQQQKQKVMEYFSNPTNAAPVNSPLKMGILSALSAAQPAATGVTDFLKGLIAPVIKTTGGAALKGAEIADELAGAASGKGTNLSPETKDAVNSMFKEGMLNLPQTVLTLSPFAGEGAFSKMALPTALGQFGADKIQGQSTGKSAEDAAKMFFLSKILGLPLGRGAMAAAGAGLQAANELSSGQNPLSPEGLGGIGAAGVLGALGGRLREKGLPLGESAPEWEKTGGGGEDIPESESAFTEGPNRVNEPIQVQTPSFLKTPETAKEIHGILSPQTVSDEAQAAADRLRIAKANIANERDLQSYQFKDAQKFFDKQGDSKNIQSISSYEQTGKFSDAPAGYSEMYRQSMQDVHTILKSVYGDDKVGYVQNYVRRMFVFGSEKDQTQGEQYLMQKSLSGGKSVLKSRTLDMPLSKALEDMHDRGIDVRMATTNPEELRQWAVANARRTVEYANVWDQFNKNGMIQYAKLGAPVPDGYVPLNDKVAQIYRPPNVAKGEENPILTGRYYASPDVARILNNAVSQGLEGSASYRAARSINNSLNQLQLGLSAFHLTGVAIDAGVSDLALAVKKMVNGDLGGGLKKLGRGAVPGLSFTKDMFQGKKFIDDLMAEDPAAEKVLREQFNPAGGRLKIDQRYVNQQYKNMIKGFKSGTVSGVAGGIVRIPAAVIDAAAKPLMEYAIPRVKIGAFLDLASEIQREHPDADPASLQRLYAKAWDSMDNRFGLLTYDNLFWNQTTKDLAMLATRSVGWNLGTIRELGGGALDLATQTARGKGFSDRSYYLMALPIYVGTIGAVYQYLHTGKGPQSLMDYFYPQNGQTTSNGNPDRTTLPTYMKDIASYTRQPIQTLINKQSPLLNEITSLIQNKNYFGDMIRNPEDPVAQQFEQAGQYLLSENLPFSLQNIGRSMSQKANPEQQVENFLGFTHAPVSVTRTVEQNALLSAIARTKGTMGTQTPEQQQAFQQKKALQSQAEDMFAHIMQMPPADRNNALAQIQNANPDLATEITSIAKDQALGLTYTDRLLKQLGIKDGSRADYIFQKIQSMPKKADRIAYLKELNAKNLLGANGEVADQLAKLMDTKHH